MSLTVVGDLHVTASISETLANAFGGGKFTTPIDQDYSFGAGTGANNINEYWPVTSTASAAPDTWTLSSLTDGLGRSIALAKVRGFIIYIPAGVDGQDLQIRWPTVAVGTIPTAAASGSDGTLSANTYLVSYTFVNANGESTRSPDQTVVVSATNHITVTLPTLPTGATGINVYLSTAGGVTGTETKQNLLPITTTSYTITALAAGPAFPIVNTCYYRGWVGISPAGVPLRAGGMVVLCAPMATSNPVTTTTGDQIVIDPGANTITYKILAFGQ